MKSKLEKYELREEYFGYRVLLSEEETKTQEFDVEKFANTFEIEEDFARLVLDGGKNYVFAVSKNGQWWMFYHPSLLCNDLQITALKVTPEYFEDFKKRWGKNDSGSEFHFYC